MKMFLELFNLANLVTVFEAVVPLDRKTTQFWPCAISESGRGKRDPDVTGPNMTDTLLVVLTLLLEHNST